MKYLQRALTVTVLGCLSSSAFAAGEALSGFDLNAGVGFTGSSSKETYTGSGGDYYKYGSQDNALTLGLGYAHSFGKFNLGGHFSMDTGSQDVGGEGSNSYSYKLQIDKLWSLSLEPGVVLGDTAVAYLKLAYVKADTKVDYRFSTVQLKGSDSVTDVAFGFGVRAQVTTHFYVAAEVERYKFDQADLTVSYAGTSITYKNQPEQTRAMMKLGWVF